ncbi:MAG TPA: alkaline phosphatase family protein [Anaerolineae bacterium]|nr:alkaline phosphatase family protein [Anaerolineae bacterium]
MKLLSIGLDGATLDLIKPWAAQGHLPALAQLMHDGVTGPLESTLPPVTSPAWPTFMTGKNPGKHGVFDFIRPSAGTFEMVNASQIDGKLLWEILSEAGYSVGVLNVPITYPPRAVNGYLVPGLLAPDQGLTTYPPDLLKPYRAELGRYRLTPDVQFSAGQEDEFIADIHDLIDTQLRYALRLLHDYPTDVLMLHFLASDNASHALWRYMDPTHPRHDPALAAKYGAALLNVYKHLDTAVQTLNAECRMQNAEIANIVVMSDHGFGPLHRTVNLNMLFLETGLMRLKSNALTRLRYAMFKRGLTPKSVYRLLEKIGVQNLTARVSRQTRNQMVGKFLSFEDVDWSRTVAYSMGHVGQVYLNLQGREPQGIVEPSDYQATRQRVVEVLNALHDPDTGRPLVDRIIPREAAASGPYLDRAPDLHLVLDGYRAIAFPLFAAEGQIVTQQIRGDSGCHRLHGVLIASGPAFARGAIEGARLIDLAPTILHLLGVPVPADMDGRVLAEALSDDLRARAVTTTEASAYTTAQVDLSADEQAEVEERLRALGYLG